MDRRALLKQERLYQWTDKPNAARIALVFPNAYALGMSNLGFQWIYHLLNAHPDWVCERFFLEDGPSYSLETGRSLKEFDVIAFSLSFELDYPNVLRILERSGLPLTERTGPLVIAGGPAVMANPEPMAAFLDVVLLGEAESNLYPCLEAFLQGGSRLERLERIAQQPGCYVPSLYQSVYDADGYFLKTVPVGDAPPIVQRQYSRSFAETVILTPNTEFADTFLVEVSRGCAHRCRFCLAGNITRPFRARPIESIKAAIEKGLEHTPKIGLLGAAVSDLPMIDELGDFLLERSLRLYISSIRADRVTPTLIRVLRHGGLTTLTVAPEAGSEAMRRCICKDLSAEEILRATAIAAEGGMSGLKFYFMVGLPHEKPEDIAAIPELLGQAIAQGRPQIRQFATDVHPFVPKAHTPFQWAPMASVPELEKILGSLSKPLAKLGVKLRFDSAKWAHVQEVLARGDRRTAEILLAATQGGGALGAWRKALSSSGVPRRFLMGEPLPWDHIHLVPNQEYLKKEYHEALGG